MQQLLSALVCFDTASEQITSHPYPLFSVKVLNMRCLTVNQLAEEEVGSRPSPECTTMTAQDRCKMRREGKQTEEAGPTRSGISRDESKKQEAEEDIDDDTKDKKIKEKEEVGILPIEQGEVRED